MCLDVLNIFIFIQLILTHIVMTIKHISWKLFLFIFFKAFNPCVAGVFANVPATCTKAPSLRTTVDRGSQKCLSYVRIESALRRALGLAWWPQSIGYPCKQSLHEGNLNASRPKDLNSGGRIKLIKNFKCIGMTFYFAKRLVILIHLSDAVADSSSSSSCSRCSSQRTPVIQNTWVYIKCYINIYMNLNSRNQLILHKTPWDTCNAISRWYQTDGLFYFIRIQTTISLWLVNRLFFCYFR